MKVRLNLAASPLENNRRFIAGSGVLGLLALFALVVLSAYAYRNWRDTRQLRLEISGYESRIETLQHRRQELVAFFKNPKSLEVTDHAAFLNSLIEQRSFPWTKLFMDLEQTLPAGVRVVSIAPTMEKGRVRVKLVVGALTDEGKLKFLKALEDSKAFSDIQVRQETRPQGGSTDRVMLDLEAWYATT
jgi:Tfp pilus assembly protein PilN